MSDINAVSELFKQDFSSTFMSVFIICVGVLTIIKVFEEVSKRIGKPVAWIKGKEEDHKLLQEDHKLLLETIKNLSALHNKHEEDTEKCVKHDEVIRKDIQSLADSVGEVSKQVAVLQDKIEKTEMVKLKEKLLSYYRKYEPLGEWQKFESDVFWELYDRYTAHDGNSFIKDEIQPVMRKLLKERLIIKKLPTLFLNLNYFQF